MDRRTFLATLSSFAALDAVPTLAANREERVRTTSNTLPRKVIVGTALQSFWGPYPGLRNRLDQLAGIVDQMAAQAKQAYGRGLERCGFRRRLGGAGATRSGTDRLAE